MEPTGTITRLFSCCLKHCAAAAEDEGGGGVGSDDDEYNIKTVQLCCVTTRNLTLDIRDASKKEEEASAEKDDEGT